VKIALHIYMNNLCVHLFVGKLLPFTHLMSFQTCITFSSQEHFRRSSSMKASAIQKTYGWVKYINLFIIKQNYCILYLVEEFT